MLRLTLAALVFTHGLHAEPVYLLGTAGVPVTLERVVDGDTVRLHGWGRVRFGGWDAPETGYRAHCDAERLAGARAADALAALIDGAVLHWEHWRDDWWGRSVGWLYADGMAVTAAMGGHLRPWPHDKQGRALAPKPNWCPRSPMPTPRPERSMP